MILEECCDTCSKVVNPMTAVTTAVTNKHGLREWSGLIFCSSDCANQHKTPASQSIGDADGAAAKTSE